MVFLMVPLLCFGSLGEQYNDVENVEAIKLDPATIDGFVNALGANLRIGIPWKDATFSLVAWSCKLEKTGEIPNIVEEVVLLIKVSKKPNTYYLVSLVRIRGSDQFQGRPGNRKWEPNYCEAAIKWEEVLDGAPSPDRLFQFFKESNFGKNELFSDRRKTLKVVVYGKANKKLLEFLGKGISQAERIRRKDRLLAF